MVSKKAVQKTKSDVDKCMTVAFAGNPNCGKTTLFNAYTGAHLRVANWPGVTVERKEGAIHTDDIDIRLVDLPGTYSLTSYTLEESVTREYLQSCDVDVIVNVVDASQLEHSLYLTLQLLELGKPVVVALNMMDVVKKRGMEIDLHRFPELLGVPVIPVSARKREGLGPLMHAVLHHQGLKKKDPIIHQHENIPQELANKHEKYVMVYSQDLERAIETVSCELTKDYPEIQNVRWHAIKILEQDKEICEKYPCKALAMSDGAELEDEFIKQRYDFISEIVHEVLFNRQKRAEFTDKVDRILTNRFLSIPIFMLVMLLVFVITFSLGGIVQTWLEAAFSWLSDAASAFLLQLGASEVLVSVLIDGALSGVGAVLSFLPWIALLFLSLGFLEDSGYMSRVAYVMDGIMAKFGLSGRACIPMILGFGCNVPAIMSSRVLENKKDRRRVMLVIPFMSCSARLPIYALFAGLFFGKWAGIVAASMYFIGIVVALLVLRVLHLKDNSEQESMLLIELPEYKMPDVHTVCIYVWTKVKDYLLRAGTTIFVASIVVWALLNFGPQGYVPDAMDATFGAYLGHIFAPFLQPLGLGDWRIALVLLAGVSAKEVVVATFAILFAGSETAALGASLAAIGFGPAHALALMVFCLLYVPCVATIGVIKKESASLRFTFATILLQLITAWLCAYVVFHIALLFFAA